MFLICMLRINHFESLEAAEAPPYVQQWQSVQCDLSKLYYIFETYNEAFVHLLKGKRHFFLM